MALLWLCCLGKFGVKWLEVVGCRRQTAEPETDRSAVPNLAA